MKAKRKNALLDKLSVCYNRVNYLKTLCEEQGLTDQSVQLGRRKERLKSEIDRLSRDLYVEWLGGAGTWQERFAEVSSNLEKAIKDVETRTKIAENIAKAIGCIDDIVKIAANVP